MGSKEEGIIINIHTFFIFVIFPAIPILFGIGLFLEMRKRLKNPKFQTPGFQAWNALTIVFGVIVVLIFLVLAISFIYSYLRYA